MKNEKKIPVVLEDENTPTPEEMAQFKSSPVEGPYSRESSMYGWAVVFIVLVIGVLWFTVRNTSEPVEVVEPTPVTTESTEPTVEPTVEPSVEPSPVEPA